MKEVKCASDKKSLFMLVSADVKTIKIILLLLVSICFSSILTAREAVYWTTTSQYFPWLQGQFFTGYSPSTVADAACDYIDEDQGKPNAPSSFIGVSRGACISIEGTFYTRNYVDAAGTFRSDCRATCAYRNGGTNDITVSAGYKTILQINVSCGTLVQGTNPAGDEACERVDDPKKSHGCARSSGVGNPCNVANGNKFQLEIDFSHTLPFTRSYNSLNLASLGLGKGWRHNHQRKLIILDDELIQVSGTGRGESWVKVNGAWQGDADSKVAIVETPSSFQLTKGDGALEVYNSVGQIVSITDSNGHQTSYSYSGNGKLSQILNHYGQAIMFSYEDGKLSKLTDALGAEYAYEYDANNNLVSIVFPDETLDDTDNPRKIYHYENPDFPNHLTGITDENGNRYATYAYDVNGNAILTEHTQTSNPVGQERFELDYQGNP